MKVIAVTNHKGGVGKTHTAFNLAGAYAEDPATRVLLVDLDPQMNLTGLFLGPEDRNPSLFDVLVEEMPLAQAIHPTRFQGIGIVPSSRRLRNLDAHLHNEPDAQTRLAEALRELPADQHAYAVALLDCPPNLDLMTRKQVLALLDRSHYKGQNSGLPGQSARASGTATTRRVNSPISLPAYRMIPKGERCPYSAQN